MFAGELPKQAHHNIISHELKDNNIKMLNFNIDNTFSYHIKPFLKEARQTEAEVISELFILNSDVSLPRFPIVLPPAFLQLFCIFIRHI